MITRERLNYHIGRIALVSRVGPITEYVDELWAEINDVSVEIGYTDVPATLETIEVQPAPVLQVVFDINDFAAEFGWPEAVEQARDLKVVLA